MLAGSRYKQHLTEEESQKSSTYRELRGIEEGLRVRGESLRGHLVRWGCDNWAASKMVKLGIMKPDYHEVTKRIDNLVKKHELLLEPFWLSRYSVQITLWDVLSKNFDTSDPRLDAKYFRRIESKCGPFTIDYTASSFSCQFKPFYSKLDCAEAAGHSWLQNSQSDQVVTL